MPTHDFISDLSGRHLLRLDDTLKVPEFVKTCSVNEESVAGLPRWLFALPAERKFPMDSAGHTYLSYGYAKSAGVQDPELLQRLRVAGETFHISDSLDAIDQAFAPAAVKQAAASQFAVTINFGPGDAKAEDPMVKEGGVRGFYPINSADEILDSARNIVNDCHRIPGECFLDGCRTLVKAAAAHPDVQLPSLVQFYGEDRLPVLSRLEERANLAAISTGDAGYADLYKQAAACADQFDADGLRQCAEAWHNKDRQHSKVPLQDLTKQASVHGLFQTGPKVSEVKGQLEKWARVGEALVPRARLQQLTPEEIDLNFPKIAVGQIKAALAVQGPADAFQGAINGLPDAVQKRLARLVLQPA